MNIEPVSPLILLLPFVSIFVVYGFITYDIVCNSKKLSWELKQKEKEIRKLKAFLSTKGEENE